MGFVPAYPLDTWIFYFSCFVVLCNYFQTTQMYKWFDLWRSCRIVSLLSSSLYCWYDLLACVAKYIFCPHPLESKTEDVVVMTTAGQMNLCLKRKSSCFKAFSVTGFITSVNSFPMSLWPRSLVQASFNATCPFRVYDWGLWPHCDCHHRSVAWGFHTHPK